MFVFFALGTLAQTADTEVTVSVGPPEMTISMQVPIATAPTGPCQAAIKLDGVLYCMTEEGFEQFITFANRDDMTFSVSGGAPADDRNPDSAPLLNGIMFDGLPIDVLFTNRDRAVECKAICAEAPDCLAFTCHSGDRQCDMFWQVHGEIPDTCCVSRYLE